MSLDQFGGDDPAPPTGPGKVIVRLVLATAVAGLLAAGLLAPIVMGAGALVHATADRFLTAHCDVRDTVPPQRSTLLARDGKTVIAHLFTQNRAPVRLGDVPRPLVQALIATEDRRFYHHHGVDLRGLLRATLHDMSGGDTQGGSTLTMQYVKQVRYYQARTNAERQAAIAPNLGRKLQNAKCAIEIEHHYSKAQILQKYLDIAFFGENSYGVATAAKTYFARPVARLTVAQSALLVGLLQAPSQYDPFLHPLTARARRNQVLANMVDVGNLTPAVAARYQRAPLTLASRRPPPVPEGCAYAGTAVANSGFFCDCAIDWLHRHGVSQQALDTGGLRVVTTLDARLQASGQRAVWRAGLKTSADYILVMPSVDPATGNVTTMITSRRYGNRGARGESTEPLFTAAYAGAGSTYKYFTAAAALTAGARGSLRLTTPGNHYRTKHCASGHYRVHNAGNYPDTMPLRDALPQSSNTYFVALEDQFFGCHLGPIVDTALKLGMDRLRAPLTPAARASIAAEVVRSQEPTFTLGQEPTSALQLSAAFGAAVHDGVFCPPAPVLRVTRADGSALPLHRPACRRVLSPYVARTLVTMMRHDTHDGTASGYFQNWYAQHGSDVAGKTGTDNNAADNGNAALWFVGMTPRLVAAASLVNPQHPKQTVHGLPGMPGASVGQDVFGAYAATYWLDAYGPALQHPWSWPAASGLPGSRVPSVIGRSRASATSVLRQAGFRMAVFPVRCGSDRRAGAVAYQEPPRAVPGATVTICLSSGTGIYVPPPPPPIIVTPPHPPHPPPPHGGGHHKPH
jgi:membrane peptidoglycan carboxypeptidase